MRYFRRIHTLPLKPSGADTKWRYWVGLLLAWTLVPLLIPLCLEMGLRISGYGVPITPFSEAEAGAESFYLCNFGYAYDLFYKPPDIELPDRIIPISKNKPENTYRIVVFGSSAAKGFPLQLSFSNMLQLMLMERFPGVRFEVFNCANSGLNSAAMHTLAKIYGVIKPDAYLIYMGNNEINGPYSIGPYKRPSSCMGLPQYLLPPGLIRCHQKLRQLRLMQWFDRLVQNPERAIETQNAHELVPPHDPRLSRVWRNFEGNLQYMFQAAASAGTKVYVSTLGANVRDWPPDADIFWEEIPDKQKVVFESLRDAGMKLEETGQWLEAYNKYCEAEAISAACPHLFYRQASCCWAMGNYEQARVLYEKALEMDAFIPVRAKKDFNNTVRRAVELYTGDNVILVEGQAYLENVSEHKVSGSECFIDACHFNYRGNYILAQAFYDQIARNLPDWVKAQEAVNAGLPDVQTILSVFGFDENIPEQVLEYVVQIREKLGDKAVHVRAELEHVRNHPPVSDSATQSVFLENIVSRGMEDLFLAQKYLACLTAPLPEWSQETRSMVEKLAQRYPLDYQVQTFHARALTHFKEEEKAAFIYRRLLPIYPEEVSLYVDLAALLSGCQAFEEYEELLGQARKYQISPCVQECLRGDFLRQKGDAGSVTCYINAMAGDSPASQRALDGLYACLWAFPEVIVEKICLLEPKLKNMDTLTANSILVKFYRRIGQYYEEQTEFSKACAWYKETLKYSPADTDIYSRLGAVYEAIGNMDAALLMYGKALMGNPESYSIGSEIDALYQLKAREDEAILFWTSYLDVQPETAMPHIFLGKSCAHIGDIDGARYAYERTIAIRPDSAEAYYNLGALDILEDRLDEGIALLRHAFQLDTTLVGSITNSCIENVECFTGQGRYDAAIQICRLALELSPADLSLPDRLGSLYETAGDSESAIETYKTALTTNPESFLFAMKVNMLFEQVERKEEAISFWGGFAETHPEIAIPHLFLGISLERIGDIAAARSAYEKALQLKPEYAEALYRLGAIDLREGRLDTGAALMHRAIAQDASLTGSIAQCYAESADRFAQQENYETAVQLYQSALELTPLDPSLLIRLASLYESSGNMDAALELCKEALTKEPESSFIATKLDMLFQQRQDKDEAIRFWRSFSDLHPEVALPWFYLGLCLERAGDKVGVRAAYTKAMEIKPDYPEVLYRLGTAAIAEGQTEHGTALIRRAIEQDATLAGTIANYSAENADRLAEQGQYENALDLFRLATEISPSDALLQSRMGDLYLASGNSESAMEVYKKALAQEPESSFLAHNLDALFENMGKKDEALLFWRSFSEMHPENVVSCLFLGAFLERAGDAAAARGAYEKAVQINPESPMALCRLGEINITEGRLEEGLAMFRKAVERDGTLTESIVQTCTLQAAILQGSGQYDLAIQLYEAALSILPENLNLYLQLGWLYETVGNTESALGTYRKLLEKEPESSTAADNFNELLIKTRQDMKMVRDEWQSIVEKHPNAKIPASYLEKAISGVK